MAPEKQRMAKAARPDTGNLTLDCILKCRVYPRLPKCVPGCDLGGKFCNKVVSSAVSLALRVYWHRDKPYGQTL